MSQDHNMEATEHDGDEELWLISYADMMTLLFGFFVILYSFSNIDDKKFEMITGNIAEAFKNEKKLDDFTDDSNNEARQIRALQMLVSMLNIGDNIDTAVSKIESSFVAGKSGENAKSLILEKVVEKNKALIGAIDQSDDTDFHTIELILPAASLFPTGGFTLDQESALKIKNLAEDLRHVANLAELEVIGHTDSRPPGKGANYDSNFTLSALRAGAVASTLIRHGVDRKRIAVRGMGDLKPLVAEFDANGKENLLNMETNRRVTILLKMRRSHVPTAH